MLRSARRREALRRPLREKRGGVYRGGRPPTACYYIVSDGITAYRSYVQCTTDCRDACVFRSMTVSVHRNSSTSLQRRRVSLPIVTLLERSDDGRRRAAENHLTTGWTSHSTSGIPAADVVVVNIVLPAAAPAVPSGELRALVYMFDRLMLHRSLIGSPTAGRRGVTADRNSAAERGYRPGRRVGGAEQGAARGIDRVAGGVLAAAEKAGRRCRRWRWWSRQRRGVVTASSVIRRSGG